MYRYTEQKWPVFLELFLVHAFGTPNEIGVLCRLMGHAYVFEHCDPSTSRRACGETISEVHMSDAALENMPHEGNSDQHDDTHGPKLQFEHVASVQDVSFRVSWSDTLQAAWDIAYLKLGEQRRPDDRLQTDDGVDMMPFLGETLRQLFDNKHTKSHKFQIGRAHV